jgi:hypothetical protein
VRASTRRAAWTGAALALLVPAVADAGIVEVTGPAVVFSDDGGSLDRLLISDQGGAIRIADATAALEVGPGCDFESGSDAVTCPKAGVGTIVLNLGGGDDTARVAASVTLPVRFNGSDGNDALFGGGAGDHFAGGNGADLIDAGLGNDVIDGQAGRDDVRAGGGDDDIEARDGAAEVIDCGEGTDTARADDADSRTGCELPTPTPTSTPTPTPTATPAITPAPTQAPVASAPNPTPTVPATRLRVINPRFDYSTAFTRTATRFTEFLVSGVPTGTTVRLTCRGQGCPRRLYRKTFPRGARRVNLISHLRGRWLAVGAVLELTSSAPGARGTVQRFRVRSNRRPMITELCLPAGAQKPRRRC